MSYQLAGLGTVVCHVRARNCGWIATYDKCRDAVIVDTFELSAENMAVIAEPQLLRQFPGVGVLVPIEMFRDRAFLSYLTPNLAKLVSEEVEEVSYMVPTRTRAGARTEEHRASTHPGLVTECLMTQLLALGKPNDDPPLVKRVRDDILWDNALLPWRRSAAWLVLRVTFQAIARRHFMRAEGDFQYKYFMLFLMTVLGEKESAHLRPNGSAIVDHLEIVRAKLGRRYCKLKGVGFSFDDHYVTSVAGHLLNRLLTVQSEVKMLERSLFHGLVSQFSGDIFECSCDTVERTYVTQCALLPSTSKFPIFIPTPRRAI